MTSSSDADLIERFIDQRDENAFAELVRRHGPQVLGVCRRILGNPTDAEDAGQAVFMTLAAKAASLRRHPCLAGWLHQVSRHVALHMRAGDRRRRTRERAVAAAHDAQHLLPDAAESQLREELDAAIGELPERYRQPLLLHHVLGCDYAEIARQLDLRIDTVGARLSRARERLRSLLTSRGVACSVAGLVAVLATPHAEAVTAVFVQEAVRNGSAVAAGGAIAAPSQVIAAVHYLRRLLWLARLRAAGFVIGVASVGLALSAAAVQAFAAASTPPVPIPAAAPTEAGGGASPASDAPMPVRQFAGIHVFGGGNRFTIEQGGIGNLAFSPDGRHVACGATALSNGSGLTVWNVPEGTTESHLLVGRAVDDCLWLDDRRIIALCSTLGAGQPDGAGIALIDSITGLAAGRLAPADPGIAYACRLDLSPGNKTVIATDGGSQVLAWDIATGQRLPGIDCAESGDPTPMLYIARFSPDGRQVACCDIGKGGGVSIWDWPSRHRISHWRFPADCHMTVTPMEMRWDASGTTLTFSAYAMQRQNRQATLEFSAMDGHLVHELPGMVVYNGRQEPIGSLADAGTFTFTTGDHAGQTLRLSGVAVGLYCFVISGTVSPDGSLLLVRWTGSSPMQEMQLPIVIDLVKARQVSPTVSGPSHAPTWLAFSEDGRLLGADGARLFAWDLATGDVVATAAPDRAFGALTVTALPALHLLATGGAQEGGVQLWNSGDLTPAGRLKPHGKSGMMGYYNWIDRIDADGPLLATENAYGSVRFHDASTRHAWAEIAGSPDDNIPGMKKGYQPLNDRMTSMHVRRDGSLVYLSESAFSSGEGLTGGWDPHTGERRLVFRMADGSPVRCSQLDLDEDSNRCLLLDARPARLGGSVPENNQVIFPGITGFWDAGTGKFLRQLPDMGRDAHFSTDHDRIIALRVDSQDSSGRLSKTILTYDTATMQPLGSAGPYPEDAFIVSDDGTAVAVVVGGALKIIDIPSATILIERSLGPGTITPTALTMDHQMTRVALGLADQRIVVVDLYPPAPAPGPVTAKALLRGLSSPDAKDASDSLSCLVALGSASVPALTSALASARPDTARRALHGLEWLARQGSQQALEALRAGASSSASVSRQATIAALRRLQTTRSQVLSAPKGHTSQDGPGF